MNIYSPTISGSLTISGSIITTGGGLPLTGSLVSSGSFTSIGPTVISGSLTVITGSSIEFQVLNTGVRIGNLASDNHNVTGSLRVSGSVTGSSFFTAGTITAQTLVVQTISSSVSFITGSTRFGNNVNNNHVFTGSVYMTGSFRFGASNQQTSGTERIYVGQNSAVGIDDANSLSLFVTHAPATGSPQIGFTYQFRTNDNAGGNLYGDAIKVVKNAGANTTYTIFSTNSTIGAGTERMRIDASGNVGIGTSSPNAKLNVVNDDGVGSGLHIIADFNRNTSSAELILGYYGDGTNVTTNAIYSANSLPLAFYTNATERMRITSAGDLSINTTTTNTNTKVKIKASSEGTGIGLSSSTLCVARAASDTQLNIGYYSTPDAFVISSTYGTDGAYKPLAFATSDTERMRITSGGNVAIGTTTIPSDIPGLIIGGTNTSVWRAYGNYSAGAVGMDLSNSSNSVTIQFFGSTGNYYFAGSNISDRRSKTNIQEINNALPNLLQLKPSTFAYNLHPTIIKGGFIAQEVQEILPDFVTVPEDETEMMGVDYNGILALAVKAIQELKSQNDALQSRIETLEQK
jgi:hypothetical protein